MVNQLADTRQLCKPLDPSLELVLLGRSDGSFSVSVADQEGSQEDAALLGSYEDDESSSSSSSSVPLSFLSSIDRLAYNNTVADAISSSSHDRRTSILITSLNPNGTLPSKEKENFPRNNQEWKGETGTLSSRPKSHGFKNSCHGISRADSAANDVDDATDAAAKEYFKHKRILKARTQSPPLFSCSGDAISLVDSATNDDDHDDVGNKTALDSRKKWITKTRHQSPSSFSCSCDAISLVDVAANEDDDDDTAADVAVAEKTSAIAYLFGDMRFSDAFSCGAVEDGVSTLASARTETLSVKHLDSISSTNRICTLPQEHGPIRSQVIADDDSSLSSNKSEALTDHVSNVSFAKLASTIITSQAVKKAVEPLDRIAALLESKGVGRGTHFFRDIRESTELRLLIDDYSNANYWPMLDSLYFNRGLCKLVLFRNRTGDQARVRTHQEVECLLRVLSRSSSTLIELHLWNFSPDDQPQLSRGLAFNPSIEYIQLHLESGAISLSLAKSLSTLPNLTSLELEVSSSFPVSRLLNSKSLGVLTVICCDYPFQFDCNEIVELTENLKDNKVLSVLHLEPSISANVALPAILEALKSRNGTLETFQFSCEASTVHEGDLALEHVIDTLCANSQLRVLWNNNYESWAVSDKMRQKVFQVLEKNKTIQQFHVFPEAADYWFKKTNVLQNNMSTG